jgi:hypothetical protein
MTNSRAISLSEDNKDSDKNTKVSQELDLEKNGPRETLQRQVSGPPYSVFSSRMKTWIIFLVSISALISPFGATTVLPALNVLTDVLDITPTKANISITTYMVDYYSSNCIDLTDSNRSHKQSLPLLLVLCRIPAVGDCPSFYAM